jgi:hypothetical protein
VSAYTLRSSGRSQEGSRGAGPRMWFTGRGMSGVGVRRCPELARCGAWVVGGGEGLVGWVVELVD